MIRRARVLIGAVGLTVAMGVGLVGPASAASITPIKPINPAAPSAPQKPPPAAPAKGPRIPFPGLSPNSIKNKAIANARKARSVRVQGTVLGAKNEKITWDAYVSRTGGTMKLTSTVQGTVNVRRVGTRLFLAGDQKFWVSSNPGQITTEQAALLADKWVEILGNSKNAQELRSYLTIGAWTDALATFRVTQRVAGKTIGGKKTLGLFEKGAQGGILYVATSGATYPMGAVSNDRTVTLSYTRWNGKFNITAPPVILRVPL